MSALIALERSKRQKLSASHIALLFFVWFNLAACGWLLYSPRLQTNHADLSSASIYHEINGIDRDLHREVRQTVGTKLSTMSLDQLEARHDLSPRRDPCPVYFGQPSIQPQFSIAGIFHGAAVGEVAAKLKDGRLTPESVPIQFIWIDGKKVTVNNRSLTVLYKSARRPTKLVDRSGSLPARGIESLEEVLLRLEGMAGKPSTEMLVRTRGLGRDGSVKEASAWDAPIGEIVTMPDDLLKEAKTCKQANRPAMPKTSDGKM
jgi:hypothetical protein